MTDFPPTEYNNVSVTVSENAVTETSKTDKTYSPVTNAEFLDVVFATCPPDIRPVVVSFAGNPAQVAKGAWAGNAWQEESQALPPEHNNYFSVAAFRPDDAGRYRRQKRHFVALYAVMLDDIGTKIATERMILKPSWLLETSPDNYQAGYVLAEPLTDAASADRLMNAIIEAGLCDVGANGATARLARLPQGVNGKHSPAQPFSAVWQNGILSCAIQPKN